VSATAGGSPTSRRDAEDLMEELREQDDVAPISKIDPEEQE
jgi:hypothetical protein